MLDSSRKDPPVSPSARLGFKTQVTAFVQLLGIEFKLSCMHNRWHLNAKLSPQPFVNPDVYILCVSQTYTENVKEETGDTL